ncbi:hypothetical protein NDU88_002997 [Pleurodeles waltl]|uniref:Uncharacterized protein n=1 Tax=Pleurodeles waltl TaxID=8319 RepID=A0AAV7T497_PLEWA|nr:hypothetical protein NDU88_002997 [Pleurodeles waltl]
MAPSWGPHERGGGGAQGPLVPTAARRGAQRLVRWRMAWGAPTEAGGWRRGSLLAPQLLGEDVCSRVTVEAAVVDGDPPWLRGLRLMSCEAAGGAGLGEQSCVCLVGHWRPPTVSASTRAWRRAGGGQDSRTGTRKWV